LAAMEASLDMTSDGLPTIDGIELDVFMNDGQCLFAHDAQHLTDHVPFGDAAAQLAQWIATHERLSNNGTVFTVILELKPQVDGRQDTAAHVTCTLDAYEQLRAAAVPANQTVDIVFDSYSPDLLRAVQPSRPVDEALVKTKLSIGYGVAAPLTADNYDFDEADFNAVDIIGFHGSWLTDTQRRAVRSFDKDITLWSFDLTRETLHQIQDIEPTYSLTGQAQTLRGWLDR